MEEPKQAPAEDEKKEPEELNQSELDRVWGGLNPQPLPPFELPI
jgi:hypothetical protein